MNATPVAKGRPMWKTRIERGMDHWCYSLFMVILTLFALVFDDIRILAFPKSMDDFCFTITSIIMAIFSIELVISSVAVKGYFLSFFFWLDIISTLSLLTDIGWGMDWLLDLSRKNNASSLAKTFRAVKVTKIIRLARNVRLIRIIKIYKQAEQQKKQKEKPQNDQ